MAAMTMHERLIAHAQGKQQDRIAFCQYEYVNRCPMSDIWDVYGRENVGILRHTQVAGFTTPNCSITEEKIVGTHGLDGFKRTLHTPAGDLDAEWCIQPDLGTQMISTHFVKEPKDWEIVLCYLKDKQIYDNRQEFIDNWKALGDDGIPHTRLEGSPYQLAWVFWGGLENVVMHMLDYPDLLNDVLCEMGKHSSQSIDIGVAMAAELPVPYLNFSDNLSAPIMGMTNFMKYYVPFYNEASEKLAERKIDIPVCCHTDGDMKPFWDEIDKSGLTMIESYTPPPDNDTPVATARDMWPYMKFGINFPSSVHLCDEDKIYARAMEIFEDVGRSGRLRLQISENPPPGRWRYSYKPLLKAINDFGGPIGPAS